MWKQSASRLSLRKPGGKTHTGARTQFYKGANSNIHWRLGAHLRPAFLAAAAAIALPLLSQSQEVPKTTIFLADYQLGVAGAYQYQGNTVYFEARIPEGSTEMSTRLLDSSGRTIAISGHSMNNVWLASSFDAAAATKSLGLASALPLALSNELDGQIFAAEISALSNLALGTQRAAPRNGPAVIDSVQNLPARSITALEAANSADRAAASQLTVSVNTPENLTIGLGGVTAQAFVENFPDGDNDENPAVQGRTEVSAQIVSNGKSLIQQIGGDSIPAGWDSTATGMYRPPSPAAVDPVEAFAEAGRAIRATALMTRFPTAASSAETGAIANLTAILREESLFPAPASLTDVVPEAGCGNCYRSSVQVWHKALWRGSPALGIRRLALQRQQSVEISGARILDNLLQPRNLSRPKPNGASLHL